MIKQQHPITPPTELVRQWAATNGTHYEDLATLLQSVATQAVRWGADQELEACCEWLKAKEWIHPEFSDELRAARRLKPPSLAKQGCDALDTYIYGNPNHKDKERTYNTIRAALERLKELENNG